MQICRYVNMLDMLDMLDMQICAALKGCVQWLSLQLQLCIESIVIACYAVFQGSLLVLFTSLPLYICKDALFLYRKGTSLQSTSTCITPFLARQPEHEELITSYSQLLAAFNKFPISIWVVLSTLKLKFTSCMHTLANKGREYQKEEGREGRR